jgi:hypothetical protein
MYVETVQTTESIKFEIDNWMGGLIISGEQPTKIVVTQNEWKLLTEGDYITVGPDDSYKYEFDEMFYNIIVDTDGD